MSFADGAEVTPLTQVMGFDSPQAPTPVRPDVSTPQAFVPAVTLAISRAQECGFSP